MEEGDSVGSTCQSPMHMCCWIRGCMTTTVRLPSKIVPGNYISGISPTFFGGVMPYGKFKAIEDFAVWTVRMVQNIANEATYSQRGAVHPLPFWWKSIVCLGSAWVSKHVAQLTLNGYPAIQGRQG